MPAALPVSRLVNVTVNLAPSLAQFPNFNSLLILGTSNVIDVATRMRSYSTIAAVAADFGTTAEEYLAALLWFQQSPQPTELLIGRWANAATAGQLFGGGVSAANQLVSAWTAINNGAFKITIDGVGPSEVGNLDFSAVENLNAVAGIIESGFPGGTATAAWDAENARFVITSATTGVASTISFLEAPDAGTDISAMLAMLEASSGAYVADGIAAETALEAVVIFDDLFSTQFYGLVIPSADDAAVLEVAAYIEAGQIHIYGVTTQEAGVLVAGDQDDIAYELANLGYDRSPVQYSSTSPYAITSALARILTTNWAGNNTTITLMYKDEPGIAAETLTETQAAAVQAKNANVFVNYNNDTAIIQYGTVPSGQFLDTIIGCDWLKGQIQTNVFNLLYGSTTKIPQTDAGMNLIKSAITAACDAAVNNGLVAPGVWNSGGFGQLKQGDFLSTGYYIYAPPLSSQSPADRAARKSVPFRVAVKLAGAVHTVDVIVDVNV